MWNTNWTSCFEANEWAYQWRWPTGSSLSKQRFARHICRWLKESWLTDTWSCVLGAVLCTARLECWITLAWGSMDAIQRPVWRLNKTYFNISIILLNWSYLRNRSYRFFVNAAFLFLQHTSIAMITMIRPMMTTDAATPIITTFVTVN